MTLNMSLLSINLFYRLIHYVHSPLYLQVNHGKPFLSQKSNPLWRRPSDCGFSTCRITPTTSTGPGGGSRWRGLRGWTLAFWSTARRTTRARRCLERAECVWRIWALATMSMASSLPRSLWATTGMPKFLGALLMNPTASLHQTPLPWMLWRLTPCSSPHIHKKTATWCLHMPTTPRQQSIKPRTTSPTTTATPSYTDTQPRLQSSPLSPLPSPLPTWDAPILWLCITLSTAVPATQSVTQVVQDSSPHLLTPTLTQQTVWSRCTRLSCLPRWTAVSLSNIWTLLRGVWTWQGWRTGHTRRACKDPRASYRLCCRTPRRLCITVATTTPNLLLGCCKDTWSDLRSLQLQLDKK